MLLGLMAPIRVVLQRSFAAGTDRHLRALAAESESGCSAHTLTCTRD